MNTLQAIRWLEKHLAEELHGAHLRNQVNRFIWSLLASLVASLTASQGHLSWSTLWALVPPALWIAAEETWPSIPWKTVQDYLHSAAQPPIVPPLPAPPTPQVPGAGAAAHEAGSPSDAAQTPESRP